MVKLKPGKRRTLSSRLWLERQINDPYVLRAKREGYRSRAAYKLAEIDDKFHFLKPGGRVVDLGAAPGGWSQVAARRVGERGRVVAIDILDMPAIAGVDFLQLDFLDDAAPERLKAMLGGAADVVLSDMAANATGHRKTDHLRIMALAEAAAAFAARGAGAGRRLRRQGAAGWHRGDAARANSNAISPASGTSSRPRAVPIRRSFISWPPGFAGASGTSPGCGQQAPCILPRPMR